MANPVPTSLPAAPPEGGLGLWGFMALLLAVGLRLIDSNDSSFWLDELHSFAHARRPTLSDVSDSVQRDFHAPLFFYKAHLAHEHLGPTFGPHALRLPNFLAGLLTLVPIGLLAARIAGRRAGWFAVLLAAALPFEIHYATECRPYAGLFLCAAAAVWAAFDDRGPAYLRAVVFFAATACGLLTQFLMGIVVFGVGFARVCTLSWSYRKRGEPPRAWRPLPLWALIAAGTLGVAALLPWIVARMPWVFQSGGGELAPPDDESNAGALARAWSSRETWTSILEQPFKIVVPRIGALGSPWSTLAVGGIALLAAAVGGAALVGAWRAVRRRSFAAQRGVAGPLVAIAACAFVSLALLTKLQVDQWHRFVLRYDVIVAWAPPVLMAWVAGPLAGRAGRLLRGCAVAAALLLGLAETKGNDFEEIRTAVRVARETGTVLALAEPTRPPLYTSLLWQPRFFSSLLPLRAYAPDVDFRAPELLPRPGEPGFERPVVVVTEKYHGLDDPKVWDDSDPMVGGVRGGRRVLRHLEIDRRTSVWIFGPADAAASRPESR